MKIRALEISELNSYIKKIIINDPILYNIKVKGEISNLKIHSSGNVYLSLKDDKSKINCIVFKRDFDKDLELSNGTKIIADGYVSVYERDGAYQLYINKIEIEGIGNLYIEFNKLKQKLEHEGLFSYEYKKEIPKMPKSIGIVTSETGAVIRDIINVIKRRYPKVEINLYPVNVQGEQSKYDICEGIRFFNEIQNVDTIIVGRGGGSIEELWSFNEEIVARAVFESRIPIISAVGHETDFTICDFVSDMRAPTPSAAAEIATPLLEDLYYKLSNIKSRINKSVINKVEISEHQLNTTFNQINSYLDAYIMKDKFTQINIIYDKITSEMKYLIESSNEKLINSGAMLHSLSPLATMNRGYGIIQKEGKIISDIKNINTGDTLNIRMTNGEFECEVNHTTNNMNEV